MIALIFFFASLLDFESHKQQLLLDGVHIPGWCRGGKAEKLMDSIHELKPQLCVEIGSLAGSATYPMACTLRYLGQGILYAIDTWDNASCLEGLDPDDPNVTWWPSLGIDMEQTHRFFLDWISRQGFQNICHPMRMRSDQAAALFADGSIDFLYIDGNISSSGSMADVTLFFPKVRSGGYIWLNLADLHTKKKAVGFLMRRCEWLKEKSVETHCILFRKN